jgi:hypothetical protein
MKPFLSLLLAAVVSVASAQTRTKYGVWTFNTKQTKVNGLAVGYTTTDRIDSVTTNGVRFELLGLGIFLPLIGDIPISKDSLTHLGFLKTRPSEKINGFNISPLGSGCDCNVNGFNIYGAGSITNRVNGISVSAILNVTEIHNGIQAAYYFNYAYKMNGIQLAVIRNRNYGMARGLQIAAMNDSNTIHGLQIGIYNKTKQLRGVQIGVLNDNGKRKRPFLNFGS